MTLGYTSNVVDERLDVSDLLIDGCVTGHVGVLQPASRISSANELIERA